MTAISTSMCRDLASVDAAANPGLDEDYFCTLIFFELQRIGGQLKICTPNFKILIGP